MRADADHAVAFLDLDVEEELAVVLDAVELRGDGARRALARAGHVLDADLEADRRLPVGELLEREHRGAALHHRDHARRAEHAEPQRPSHIGEQLVLDHELVGALHAPDHRLRRLPDSVSILGATGALGFGLALRLGRAGTPVVIGSRDAGRAQEAAERARAAVPGGDFEGLENAEAAQRSEVVVLSVPFRNQSENLTNLKGVLREGQLLSTPRSRSPRRSAGKATRMLGVWQGSAAQQAQEMVPDGVRVVSALHTVSAAILGDLDHALDEDILVCGNRKADKQVASS